MNAPGPSYDRGGCQFSGGTGLRCRRRPGAGGIDHRNSELDELELLLAEFNLFEAVGMVRQELKHAEFLAFLLDPNQNHGLGDAFVTRLLQSVLLAARGAPLPVSPLDLDVWSLDEITVQREWQHIDVLLLDEAHRLAVVIENKVDSTEHSDQLSRYHEVVRRAHPDKTFFGIYLTRRRPVASGVSELLLRYGREGDPRSD